MPSCSDLVQTMVLRLRDTLEQIGIIDWWESDEERRVWLLWILWMGSVAAVVEERWWFIGELGRLCSVMGIWDAEVLKERLKEVIWEEEWCRERVDRVWDEIVPQGTDI